MPNHEALDASSSVGVWLDHPVGGPLLRELFAKIDQNERIFQPFRSLAIRQATRISGGAFTDEMLTDLVERTNSVAGVDPGQGGPSQQATSAPSVGSGMRLIEWVEQPTLGRFAGKTVIVTGAGSGIGRATAARILREGGRVVGVDLSSERMAELKDEFRGADLETVAGDISAHTVVASVVETAGERIDGLANVAGIMDDFGGLHEVADEIWTRVFDVNVNAMMMLGRAALQRMMAAGSGAIVNVASEAALRGSTAGVAYTASKHAVIGITKNTAFLYGPRGIRINAVAPGAVMTNIRAKFDTVLTSQYEIGRSIMPSIAEGAHIAASITYLLSDDAININGQVLASDGGWSAI